MEENPLLTIFQFEITKKHLHLQIYQPLCSMTSIYLGKMWTHFSELLLLKCNENAPKLTLSVTIPYEEKKLS